MNLSDQIICALFKPNRYNEMLKLSRKKFVGYVIVLTLFMSFITVVIPLGATIAGFGGFEKLFNTNLKSIQYLDGELSLDKPFKMRAMGITVVIDTTEDSVSPKSMKADGTYLAIGSKKLSIVSSVSGDLVKLAEYKLKDSIPINFDRHTLVKAIPFIYFNIVLGFIIKAVFFFCEYALYALFLAFLLNIMKKDRSYNLPYKKLFVICFYACSLMMVLNSVDESLGISGGLLISLIGLFYTLRMATAGVLSTVEPKE